MHDPPVSIPATWASVRSSDIARIARPEVGAPEHQRDEHDRDRGDDDRRALCAGETHRSDHVHLVGVDPVRARLRPPAEEDALAEHEREPDRGQEEAHEPGLPPSQGTPQHELDQHAEQRRRDHREHHREHERQVPGDVAEVGA